MKKILLVILASFFMLTTQAQSSWGRVLRGAVKAGKALTITDEELAEVVGESVRAMDSENKVCGENSPYTKRLKRLTKGMDKAAGISLNYKVYLTSDINAFACPDGSVRVFSALMDELTDDELLGVIGHEIGHVALRHSNSHPDFDERIARMKSKAKKDGYPVGK